VLYVSILNGYIFDAPTEAAFKLIQRAVQEQAMSIDTNATTVIADSLTTQ